MKKGSTLSDFFTERGAIVELNPELARKAIQGYSDEISPAARVDEAFYRQFCCPSCGADMAKEFVGGARGRGVTWTASSVTPQALLRCTSCKLLMNPRSGIVIEQGGHVPVIPIDDDLVGVRR